jgi:16S rRNA A1518/A1519 N6-dimethyltransferase RsmA/KsgA/DIM1 with predicted DNA glycosylase/AP lyase activity
MIVAQVEKVPFVPSSWYHIETMIELARIKPGELAVDLGSGDGRILLHLAKAGAVTHGFEIDVVLNEKARTKLLENNLHAKIFERDFWNEDLSPYAIVTIYGMDSVMERLEKKLQKELKLGARVLSNIFEFPNLVPHEVKNNVRLYKI